MSLHLGMRRQPEQPRSGGAQGPCTPQLYRGAIKKGPSPLQNDSGLNAVRRPASLDDHWQSIFLHCAAVLRACLPCTCMQLVLQSCRLADLQEVLLG